MVTSTVFQFVEMTVVKVVGILGAQDERHHYVVLGEVKGAREMAIEIGLEEATSLAATIEGVDLGRPHGPHVTAAVIRGLGGQVRRVRIDQVRAEVYISTVELDGPLGSVEIDARPSDALNLAALVACPIAVAAEVVQEATARLAETTPDAERLRIAPTVRPMGIRRLGAGPQPG